MFHFADLPRMVSTERETNSQGQVDECVCLGEKVQGGDTIGKMEVTGDIWAQPLFTSIEPPAHGLHDHSVLHMTFIRTTLFPNNAFKPFSSACTTCAERKLKWQKAELHSERGSYYRYGNQTAIKSKPHSCSPV